MPPPFAFYLPENPDYTVLDSALDSIRFAARVCDDPGDGSARCASIDAVADGTLVRYRGRLMTGVGYCADTVFAAHQIIRFARIFESGQLEHFGQRLARHALDGGFFDDPQLPVLMYRDVESGEFFHNLETRPEYLELGHIARVGHQLLKLSDLLPADLSGRAEGAARRIATWVATVERCTNGWFPRRCTPDGRVFTLAPDALGPVNLDSPMQPDPIFDRSGAGSLVVQFLVEAHDRGLHDASALVSETVDAFIDAGGHFGSTNTDTEDLHENVSYALGFLALREAARAFGRPEWAEFAVSECLDPLAGFELVEDINGLATKGLLYMEDSWNSACMWEIAEAAEAYLAAYEDGGQRRHLLKALTMLRGMAKHHLPPHGFLTEAVDWDGHSVATRKVGGERYALIASTHPFLNNLHVLEPTNTYLQRFAIRGEGVFYDAEGNRLGPDRLDELTWLPN